MPGTVRRFHSATADACYDFYCDGHDVARGAADHALGLNPDGDHLAVVGVQRNHARLIEDDSPAAHVHRGVGGTEVDRHVAAKERQRIAHRGAATLPIIRRGNLWRAYRISIG